MTPIHLWLAELQRWRDTAKREAQFAAQEHYEDQPAKHPAAIGAAERAAFAAEMADVLCQHVRTRAAGAAIDKAVALAAEATAAASAATQAAAAVPTRCDLDYHHPAMVLWREGVG